MIILSEFFSSRQLGVRAGLQGPVCHWRRLRLRQRPPVPQERYVSPSQGNVPADEDGGWRILLQELFAQNKFHRLVQSAISLPQTQDKDKKSEKNPILDLAESIVKFDEKGDGPARYTIYNYQKNDQNNGYDYRVSFFLDDFSSIVRRREKFSCLGWVTTTWKLHKSHKTN